MKTKKDLRLRGVEKNKVFVGPENVNVHFTNVCNLNCSYCWFHSSLIKKKRGGDFMDFETFLNVVNDFQNLGVESISISGEGEPTLHPKIKEMIGFAKERGFRLSMNTNGTFGKDLIRHVLKLDSMTINLATLTPEKYKKLQSGLGYEIMKEVIKNIITLAKIKKKMGLENPEIKIGFVINEENCPEVERVFSFAKKYDLSIRFRMMKARGETEKLILSPKSTRKLVHSLENIIKQEKNTTNITNAKEVLSLITNRYFLKKESTLYPFEGCKRVFYYHTNASKGSKFRCFMGWYQAVIDTDGSVRLCCQSPFLIAGNVRKKSFKEIWNSEKYMKLRMLCKSGVDTNKHEWMECRHCPFYNYNTDIQKRLPE
jgi:radical SAM protein with 4Fe4S-binding SPASM domain